MPHAVIQPGGAVGCRWSQIPVLINETARSSLKANLSRLTEQLRTAAIDGDTRSLVSLLTPQPEPGQRPRDQAPSHERRQPRDRSLDPERTARDR